MTMDTLCFIKSGISGMVPSIPVAARANACHSHVTAVGREKPPSKQKSLFSRLSFKYPLKSLWSRGAGNATCNNGLTVHDDAVLVDDTRYDGTATEAEREGQNENWVLKIFRVNSVTRREQGSGGDDHNDENEEEEEVSENDGMDDDEEKECDICKVDVGDEDEEEVQFDRESFSRMLRRVTLAEARFYAQMSHLGNLAYAIPEIKPGILLKQYGLRFVTSSIEKMGLAATAEKKHASSASQEGETNEKHEGESKQRVNGGYKISSLAAHETAASYLHAVTSNVIRSTSSNSAGEVSLEPSDESVDSINEEAASSRAKTDSVTAVVAAEEEERQAVADDLNSTSSSPCNWYICDDDQRCTRFFVIQGSESFASWQANLLFEPIQFEGLDVFVHRGIYEAAKGTYQQMLPEVRAHLHSKGSRATFRFTGHSLGGSLALLVNLMLLIRNEVPISSLLPVVTFGSPSIMCGGDILLEKLGLPRSHVQAITMHRDIVPRAFSCNYPDHVAKLLKAINGNFRNLPCLNNQSLLYAPMGEQLILQPDEKFSPSHDLLPPGSGLYLVSGSLSQSNCTEKRLRAAQLVFLNSPHPLEILRDQSAYGSGGTIQRDHDMNSYLKSVRTVIRQELRQIRKARREHRPKAWWPFMALRGSDVGIVVGRSTTSVNVVQDLPPFYGIIQTGTESLKRFGRLVASQHMNLFVVLLLPARLLLLEAFSFISLR